MIARAFWLVTIFCVLSFVVGLLGCLITYLGQDSKVALGLFKSYMLHFNGIFVGGLGFGLLVFVRSTERKIFNSLMNLLEIPSEHEVVLLKHQRWVTSSNRKHGVAIIVTILGGTILWNAGYPHYGFAKYFLAVTTISLFYVAGLTSGYFFSSMLVFSHLDKYSDQIRVKRNSSPLELESLNMGFLIISTLAVVALYIAFRGTLTADFTFSDDSDLIRRMLVYPILVFLPGILFTSFYYRFVLRKIDENEIIDKLIQVQNIAKESARNASGAKEQLEVQELVMNIREKLLMQRNRNPLVTLKDSPALLVAIVLFFQFLYQNDGVLKSFIEMLLQK